MNRKNSELSCKLKIHKLRYKIFLTTPLPLNIIIDWPHTKKIKLLKKWATSAATIFQFFTRFVLFLWVCNRYSRNYYTTVHFNFFFGAWKQLRENIFLYTVSKFISPSYSLLADFFFLCIKFDSWPFTAGVYLICFD